MLGSLRVLNFRCFDGLSIELGESGALFVGDNAQGKTSILEAVCVLMRLSSPRVKRMQPMVRFDTDDANLTNTGFGIAGDIGDQLFRVNYAKGKRGGAILSVDGEELKTQTEYLQNSGLVVWMGNEDVDLVKGSGVGRRHYLDFLCSQIDTNYRVALGRYKRVLKARNVLLKDGGNRDQEINAYGELLIEYGDLLGSVRGEVVGEILPKAAEAQVAISGVEEKLSMEYISGCGGDMRIALETTYDNERRQRQTIVGPHRDDIKLHINRMPAIDYASEGQQRTLAIALKLAQGEILKSRGQKMPIYLLDDIFGELDSTRRNALMEYLPQDAQKLITTTNVDWLKEGGGLGYFPMELFSSGCGNSEKNCFMKRESLAFPDTVKILAVQISEARVDHKAFETLLKPCEISRCKATCCYDGVHLAEEEAVYIENIVREKLTHILDPDEVIVRKTKTENGKSVVKTATRMARSEELAEDFPTHFTKTRCIFLDAQGYCELQKLAMRQDAKINNSGAAIGSDHDRWRHKPLTCWMHPLVLIPAGKWESRPVLTIVNAANDPQYTDNYTGYASCTHCGKEDKNGQPAWKVLEKELRRLGDICGRNIYNELSAEAVDWIVER